MVIAFWSSFRHKSGVTACVAAMGTLWSMLYAEEVVLTTNHVSNDSLIERLKGGTKRWEKFEKKEYCYQYGEPEYYRYLYGKGMDSEILLNYGIKYRPMVGNDDAELFGAGDLKRIRKCAEESGCVMIDTACGCSKNSQKIIREADVSVIVLPAEPRQIDVFFQTGDSLGKKCFFILTNYKEASNDSSFYLNQKYKIPKERIGTLPKNYEFEQAMREGTTMAYIAGNLHCTKQSINYDFMFEARKTVKRLYRYAEKRRKPYVSNT